MEKNGRIRVVLRIGVVKPRELFSCRVNKSFFFNRWALDMAKQGTL